MASPSGDAVRRVNVDLWPYFLEARRFAAPFDLDALGGTEVVNSSRLRRPISSAISHKTLPFSAPAFDSFTSSSPASEASCLARLESLRAEAVATSAEATMSATTGFWLSVLKRFAAVELEVAFAAFLSFFSFFFFLSFATNYPLPTLRQFAIIPFFATPL